MMTKHKRLTKGCEQKFRNKIVEAAFDGEIMTIKKVHFFLPCTDGIFVAALKIGGTFYLFNSNEKEIEVKLKEEMSHSSYLNKYRWMEAFPVQFL